jgi:hypothetical protein
LAYPLTATDGQFAYCTIFVPNDAVIGSNAPLPDINFANGTNTTTSMQAAAPTVLLTLGFDVSAGTVTALASRTNPFNQTSAGAVPLTAIGVTLLYEAGKTELYCFLRPPSSFGASSYNSLNLSLADNVEGTVLNRPVFRVDVRLDSAVSNVSQQIIVQGDAAVFNGFTVDYYEVDSTCQINHLFAVPSSGKPQWANDFNINNPSLINPLLTPSRPLGQNGNNFELVGAGFYRFFEFISGIPNKVCTETYTYTDPSDYLEFQVTHPLNVKVTYRRFSRFRAAAGDASGGGIAFEIAQRP